MNKNEIIDAVKACNDRDGITATGVFVDRFKALVAVIDSYRDVTFAAVTDTPVIEKVAVQAPVEPVVEAPVEPAA